MLKKRLVHERVVREAETLLNEALERAKGGKRRLRPGDIVRYYFHASAGNPPEAVLLQGYDRVELIRQKEPAIYLQAMKSWVFRQTLCIMPNDCRLPRIIAKIDAKLCAKEPAELTE